MKRYYLNTEMTSFSRGEDLIAYFPLKETVLQINNAGLDLLTELQGEGIASSVENLQFLDGLAELELLTENKFSAEPAAPAAEDNTENYSFESLTLFLTERCNLNCSYCYADGGRSSKSMSLLMAKQAISWMAQHVSEKKSNELHVAYHGAGEPTLEEELLEKTVVHSLQKAKEYDLEVYFSIGTNGVMEESTRQLLIENNFDISLSMDGPEEHHNRLRPAQKVNSYREALRTAEACSEKELSFSIRSTVTAENLSSLPEFVTFIFEHSTCEIIQLEPIYLTGRGAGMKTSSPEPVKFIDIFEECMDRAEEYDGIVTYSGISYPALRDRFCQACGNSLCITPHGALTGCYESAGLSEDDPFHFGTFDGESGSLNINGVSLKEIRNLDRLRDECTGCIARHHCAGDCPSKMTEHPGNENYRCSINRELLRRYIIRHLDYHGEGWIQFN